MYCIYCRLSIKYSKEKCSGIYKDNPQRSTENPSAEMMLKVFRGISLIVIKINETKYTEITTLTPIQERTLCLEKNLRN